MCCESGPCRHEKCDDRGLKERGKHERGHEALQLGSHETLGQSL